MKIVIEERDDFEEIKVAIFCKRADRQVLDMVARLRMLDRKVTGRAGGDTRIVGAEEVFYIESVDRHTFIYTADEVLETGLRLYELEDRLVDCDFLRVSKGCVVNFRKITTLRPDVGGRIVASLDNGERVIVSRQYAPDVKRKLGML